MPIALTRQSRGQGAQSRTGQTLTKIPQDSLALFARDPADWVLEPVVAFDQWLVDQKIRNSSAQVYRVIWRQYLEWLQRHRLSVPQAQAEHIAEFLGSLDGLKRPQRMRYHRLLERVYDAVLLSGGATGLPFHPQSFARMANPASLAIQEEYADWRRGEHNEPTHFLCAKQRESLVAFFNQMDRVLPLDARPEILVTPKGTPTRLWRAWRNRALYAVFLGAGLKLHQAVDLHISAIDVKQPGAEYWIQLKSSDSRYTHKTVLQRDFARWFGVWLHIRAASIPKALVDKVSNVFLSSPMGKGIHKSSIQRSLVKALDAKNWVSGGKFLQAPAHYGPEGFDLTAHGIDPQGLRNSCAADWFEKGESIGLVADRLGYADLTCALRLNALWRESMQEQR